MLSYSLNFLASGDLGWFRSLAASETECFCNPGWVPNKCLGPCPSKVLLPGAFSNLASKVPAISTVWRGKWG